MRNRFLRSYSRWFVAFLGILVVMGLLVIPLPYFVMQPGAALSVGPSVLVDQHPMQKKGQFFLTTVNVRKALVWDYLHHLISKRMELVPEEQVILKGESEQEYEQRQKAEMEQSQNFAVIAAFREAKFPLYVYNRGVKILAFAKQPVAGLDVGDLVQQIDQHPVYSSNELIQYLQRKKPGQKVRLTLKRGQEQFEKMVPLVALNPRQVGIGIVPMDQVQVVTRPQVHFQTGNIGGPSAGLMFSLEIINRLLKENLTHGQKIAGTGTIDAEGHIGQIGGIQYKIMGAAKQGVHIFFCPKDRDPQDNNEQIAKATVHQLGLNMRIVPVRSLHEAVHYLAHHSTLVVS
jgi:PDZ domain-containing protein